MSLRTTFRFESNGISFELTGTEDYVRKYLPLFLPLVGAAAAGEPAKESAAAPEPAAARSGPERLKEWYERHAGRSTRLTMQDHILVFALWMRSFRKFIFTSEDIRRGFDELDLTTPKSLLQILGTLKRDRNLILGTERRGEYMLNTTGIERARAVLGIRGPAPAAPAEAATEDPGIGDTDGDSVSHARAVLGL